MISRITHKLMGTHQRTQKASKNILFSFLIKGYAMFIQFALVPFTLNYLDKLHYGVWLILTSIFEWFSYFDIGVGHGLRNKLAEALAKNDVPLGRALVSTGYALIAAIFLGLIAVFAVVNPFLDWQAILNVSTPIPDLGLLVFYVFAFFCLRFIFGLITPILFAKQEPAINNVMGPLGSTLSLGGIMLLAKFVKGSLFWASLVFSVVPLLVMVGFTVWLFAWRYKDIAPTARAVDFKYSKNLLGLGINFFIIHIAMLVLFSSASVVIGQVFGPEAVPEYSIAHRYFTIAIMVSGIVTLTYWSPFTEAFVKKDFDWIRSSIKRLNLVAWLLSVGVVGSYFLADWLVKLWVGEGIQISNNLKVALVVFVVIQLLASPYNIFINGAGKVRLQVYLALVSIVITIPLSLFFTGPLGMDSSGVVWAMVCSTVPGAILWRIQTKKLLESTAQGIWNK